MDESNEEMSFHENADSVEHQVSRRHRQPNEIPNEMYCVTLSVSQTAIDLVMLSSPLCDGSYSIDGNVDAMRIS